MKVYIKFITLIFFKSLFFVTFVMLSLVFILNLLSELEFFKDENVRLSFTFLLSLINSPSQLFEMFPFILLITIQLFFVKLFDNKEIEIFKYSGLKNSTIIKILSILSIATGIFIITVFYSFSSNLKNIYLEFKSVYTSDGKYLAVITKNGLWIKDKIDNKIIITNSFSIDGNFLNNSFISEFDEELQVCWFIPREISKKQWKIFNPKIYKKNEYKTEEIIFLNSNFDVNRIKTLYSNLSALNFFELFALKENYKKLNYSTTDVDLHLLKLMSYPLYLLLITLFSSLIMLKIKQIKGTTFKISIGLFFSVIIYYLNNFSYALGGTERIPLILSVLLPLLILTIIDSLMLYKVNEK